MLALAWAVGFLWFLTLVTVKPLPLPAAADGVVALTGGADRIRTAFALLAAGRAPRLLISGVNHETTFTEITRIAGVDPVAYAGRVSLGFSAHSTFGNAHETARWVARYGIRTLIVVTALYHMPRALIEMKRAMPQVRFYPDPVRPPAWQKGFKPSILRLLLVEYSKWLVAAAGLMRLGR